MSLTDYEFYINEYFGGLVPEPLFAKYLNKAFDKLIFLCGGVTIDEDTMDMYGTKIQKAVCVLIDTLYEIDTATQTINTPQGGVVKSISSGNESVTYANTETAITKVVADVRAQNELMLKRIYEYLYDTNLLYAGV